MIRPRTFRAHETRAALRLHGRPLAPFWRRGLALAADTALAACLFVLFAWPVERLLISLGRIENERQIVFTFFGNWYSAAWLAAYFGLATWLLRGRTPGKRLLGIRVASLTHDRPTPWQSVERALGYGFSVLELGFGFLQFFIHPNRLTVHDRVAETAVVIDRPPGPRGARRRRKDRTIRGRRS
jgi:uncharacterized RDD family membrane protein YckC